jgi:formylglycine-generating enzyme required for sulfatase activity
VGNSPERRRDLMKRYAGIDGIVEDPDAEAADARKARAKSVVERTAVLESTPTEVASFRQVKVLDVSLTDGAVPSTKSVLLEDGSALKLVRIPAGTFQSGGSEIRIEKPFWMAQCEITNRQYALYDPSHDSRLEPLDFLHFDPQRRGSRLNDPEQPAVKISWEKAVAYCGWLCEETGHRFDLPTEAEWEWACRAGTETPLWYGQIEAPFAACENLADARFHESISGAVEPWKPAIVSQNDGYRVSAPVGSFQPNPWGLYDMHGNVAEWTASEYVPSPEAATATATRTARGGSWSDRPQWAAAEMRRGYREYQKVYNVGFRVVLRND